MAKNGLRGALALALALAALSPARAQDERKGDERYGTAHLAWEHLPIDDCGAVPLWLLLGNPDREERTFRIVITGEGRKREMTVSLAPAARKRLGFVVAQSSELEVLLGPRRVLRSSWNLRPQASFLLVDGEPGPSDTVDFGGGVLACRCAAEDLPGEVSCLAGFDAVILRRVDPALLDPAARGALEDYVRLGGTLAVNASAPLPATSLAFAESKGELDPASPLPAKRHGLGRVLLVDEADVAGTAAEASAFRRRLAPLLLAGLPPIAPPFFVSACRDEAGVRAASVLGAFLAVYFLVIGPGLFIGLKRARPRRVAAVTGGVLAAFLVLGALAGGVARSSPGKVEVVTFVAVPRRGDAVAFADVTVASGGRRAHDIEIEGEDLSVTPSANGVAARWDETSESPVVTRRAAGKGQVALRGHPVVPFGEAHLSAIALARGYRPLDSRVEPDPAGPKGALRVVIANTSGRDLGPVLVHDSIATRNDSTDGVRFERIAAGETVSQRLGPLPGLGSRNGAWGERNMLDPKLIGIPPALVLERWEDVFPRGLGRPMPDYVLCAGDEPPLRVRAPDALVSEKAWRVEEVRSTVPPSPAWLGATVEPGPRGLTILSVVPGSPLANDTSRTFVPGKRIWAIQEIPVRTQADLDHVVARLGPTAMARLAGYPGAFQRAVKLSPPPSPPGGDDR